jgi:hypothetical protein
MKRRTGVAAWLVVFSSTLALAAVALAQVGRFAVQIEASPSRAEAEASAERLAAQGVAAYLVESLVPGKGRYFRVRVGDFTSRAAAAQHGRELKARGVLRDFFVAPYEAPLGATISEVTQADPIPPATPSTPPATTALGELPPAPNGHASGYARYQDADVGYAFEYPQDWVGRPLSASERAAQRVTAGAMFKSTRETAFLNATWNQVAGSNSSDQDNESVVDLILESMASGDGTERLEAVSRRIVEDGPRIKTFLDLEAAFRAPGRPAPLEFLGKCVIIRASKGILLLVAFYAKNAPPNAAIDAEHIVQTAAAPD